MSDIQTILTYLTLVSIPVGVAYHIMTLNNTRKNQNMQLETRQVQLYMDVYKSHISEENQLNTLEMLRWSWSDYDDFEAKYGVVGWSKLMSYLSQLEGIGFLVLSGFLDSNHVYDLQYNSIISLWEKFLPLTIESRERWSSPQSWDKVEFLYNEMVRIRDERGDGKIDITASLPRTQT